MEAEAMDEAWAVDEAGAVDEAMAMLCRTQKSE